VVPTHARGKRVGRWGGIIFTVANSFAALSTAAATLFPQPLHLVRRIEDPISGLTSTIHEFCEANRIVSVNGPRSVLVDYEKQTITEIDRAKATYSISTFEEIARANAALRPLSTATKSVEWKATSLAPSKWRFESQHGTIVEVAVDSKVVLSREALDALIGASYPNRRTPEHDALSRAASGDRVQVESAQRPMMLALPVDETVTRQMENSRIVARNTVIRVANDAAPTDALTIPPGAKRIQSPRVALPKMIDELDRVPAPPSRP
jgi:hypothetical protein